MTLAGQRTGTYRQTSHQFTRSARAPAVRPTVRTFRSCSVVATSLRFTRISAMRIRAKPDPAITSACRDTSTLDLGLGKSWKMPWSEGHQLQLRWDVFNVTNTQHFGFIDVSRTGWGVVRDPALRGSTPPSNWSNFVQTQGNSTRDADRGALLLLGLQMSSTQGGLRSALVFYLSLRSTGFSRDNTLWVELRPMGDSARNHSS